MEIIQGMSQVYGEAGYMPTFVAQPAASGQHPAVILAMEAFGLNDHIKAVAARIAAEGYVVAAPDFYYRQPNSVVGYDQLPDAIRLMMGLADDKILKDVAAVVKQLQSDPRVCVDRIGMTGFCMGGRITFLTACHNAAIKAAVPFYGGGIGNLMQHAEQLRAPLLLFFGGKDAFIPKTEVDKIRDRLAELAKPAEVVVYQEADHGFFCDERPSYHPQSARDAWQRMMEFFTRHLISTRG